MSHPLINHSPDLQRLRDEGYDIEIRADHLLVKQVPYVTAERVVKHGILVSDLTTSGSTTAPNPYHVVWFVGSIPCDNHGRTLDEIINQHTDMPIGGNLVASCSFSRKPTAGYPDYYAKMTSYVNMLLGYAQAIEPRATAKVFPPIPTDEAESVFRYTDSASSRAQISAITEKLKLGKVAIIGLGGTGSYILDLIAKTPIEQIHLYDGDILYTHNVFRAPGVVSINELDATPMKVEYFQRKYDLLRRNIIAHPVYVDELNIDELRDMAFVFLAMDGGPGKKFIIKKLEEFDVPFIDTGIGVYRTGNSLGGQIRTTTSVHGHRQHVRERVSFADDANNEYEQNIQVAELNMFNAAVAVIRWKRLIGFYADLSQEYSSTYAIGRNRLLNEDRSEDQMERAE
ncbi:MAG TPA: ThiF family adenylyltransferase [Ktedonobacteraceae bacterium]|nr:ThiF family adenylyltransferase [Ktedonobacteraceae bacterium]